jgi:hypothetical protein
MLLTSAETLYPKSADKRQPFLEKAVELMEGQPAEKFTAEALHARAAALASLDRVDEALVAYRELLAVQHVHAGWHCEFARLLFEVGSKRHARAYLEEAGREVSMVLRQAPQHPEGLELQKALAHELRQK